MAAATAAAAGATAAAEAAAPPPLPRQTLLTLAVAYRSEGPISSTSSSTTVRFSPSFVSKDRCLSRPVTIDPRARG